jgi:hypothetical protein
MNAKTILGLAACSLLLTYCASTRITDAPKPAELYNAAGEPPLVSTLVIPVNISVADLVQSINARLSGKALYEDYSYDDNGGDNLMLNAWKSRAITMEMSGQTIKYYIPLKIWMKKKLYVGEAEAEGELGISLKTTYSINEDWSLKTNTQVEYHEWLSPPVLKTGMGNISIESLANLALNRSKMELAQTIDRVVSQQLSLRPFVQAGWSAIQEPTLMSPEYKMWVKTTPLSISMTPITADWNTIRAKIGVQCLNDVTFGDKPVFRENSSLPNLRYIGFDTTREEFQIRIATDVPFPEAERIARTVMVGQVFESGKNKVKVEDIHLWGNNDKIVVNTKLSGSFNGQIYFIGRPVFNPQKNQVEVTDLDFHVDTRNLLYKSASWIFQGTIKKKMKDSMVFPVAENVKTVRREAQNSLGHYQLQPGILLTGTIDTVSVENTRITPTGIRVNLFSKGKVNVDVKGL